MNVQEIAHSITPETLERLSDEELFALVGHVEKEFGREILKQGERETRVENEIARELEKDFRSDLDPAIENAVSALPPEPTHDEAISAVDAVTAVIAARSVTAAIEILSSGIFAIGQIARAGTARLIGMKYPDIRVSGRFSQVDLAAVDAMAANQNFWIGNVWDASLSIRIKETVTREALEAGLSRVQVGRILRGVVEGNYPSVEVPKTFRGSIESYFEMLSGTVRNQATNWGSITTLSEVGIERYRIVAVRDERTTEICEFMHDTVFSVSEGKSLMDRIIGARDPEEVKAIAGWRTVEEAKLFAGDGEDAEARASGLASAGLALPPYHARCRTVVVPD